MKAIIKLAIAIALANALFQVGRAYLAYFQFKDAVEELALHTTGTDEQMKEKVVELAAKFDEPIDPEAIAIRHEVSHIFIETSYTKDVQLFPGYVRKWPFDVAVDGFVIVPQRLPGSGPSTNP